MGQKTQIKLTFSHPRDTRSFEAEVGPSTTAQAALDGLVKSGFLEPPAVKGAYSLQLARTGKSLPHSQSLVAQGAQDGDTIAILETGSAAA